MIFVRAFEDVSVASVLLSGRRVGQDTSHLVRGAAVAALRRVVRIGDRAVARELMTWLSRSWVRIALLGNDTKIRTQVCLCPAALQQRASAPSLPREGGACAAHAWRGARQVAQLLMDVLELQHPVRSHALLAGIAESRSVPGTLDHSDGTAAATRRALDISLIYSFMRSFVRSFIRSFVHSAGRARSVHRQRNIIAGMEDFLVEQMLLEPNARQPSPPSAPPPPQKTYVYPQKTCFHRQLSQKSQRIPFPCRRAPHPAGRQVPRRIAAQPPCRPERELHLPAAAGPGADPAVGVPQRAAASGAAGAAPYRAAGEA
jgi:hypothetical protein